MSDTGQTEKYTPSKLRGKPFPKKIDKGVALDHLTRGLTYREAGKIQGVTGAAVHAAVSPIIKRLLNKNNIDDYEKNKDSLLSAAQRELLACALDTDKLKKSSTLQLLSGYGILFDKQRLSRGESTSNLSVRSIVEHLESDRKKLLDELSNLQDTTSCVSPDNADTPDL